jgi:hypothetical protein
MQLEIDYRGNFNFGDLRCSSEYVESRLYLDANQVSKSYTQAHCKAALKMWIENELRKLLEKIIQPIIGFEANDELEKFVRALTSQNIERNVAVFKHFIQQIKRKMLGLSIEDHMMPVLTGPQRSGKSQAVTKLLKPIELLVTSKSVQALCNENEYPMFQSSYVIVLDEMAKADLANMEQIKHIISAPELSTKKYYSQRQLFIKNNATLIGTSNFPLPTILRDTSGMRRFVEINTLARCDWDAINTIDYVKLFRGVDAHHASYVEPFLKEIFEAQEEYRAITDVEQWVQECQFTPTPGAVSSLLEVVRAQSYLPFCERNGFSPRNTRGLSCELHKLGIRTRQIKSRGVYRDKLGVEGWVADVAQLPQ